ncbi:MAG: amino acid permease [Planctomycetaceae bacterium]|nr:amino acid permease [Planctomycetaceae bacterium]
MPPSPEATASPDPSEPSTPQSLPPLLGPFDAVALVVGSIIGSGIFLKVDTIASAMGSFLPILAVWLAGGVAALCGSLSVAELSAMLPHAGGPYVYLRHAYGRQTAYLWGWIEFTVVRTGSMGSLSCATVIYFNRFLESLEQQGVLPAGIAEIVPLPHAAQGLLTILAVFTLSLINIVGTRWAAWTQNLTTMIKVTFLGFLMTAPFLLGKGNSENLQPLTPAAIDFDFWRAFGLAMVAVFWPYDGWINICSVAEEIRQPQRNVPLGLAIGILAVIVIYVGTNVGYHLMLPMAHIQRTGTVAADAMGALIGNWGATVAALGVAFSTFGALNSNLLTGPRVYFAMARDGLIFERIGRVHATFRTPAHAIAVQALWSLVLIAAVFGLVEQPKQAFDRLTDFVVLGATLFFALTVAAVFVLRRRAPDLPRPYRTWGYPATPIIFLLSVGIVVGTLVMTSPWQVLTVGGLLAAGCVAYRFTSGRTPSS